MKVEMKMKILLLLILNCCLLGITNVDGAELDLAEDEMWSINGGVFHPASQKSQIDGLTGRMLIKNSKGAIRIGELIKGSSDQPVTTIVQVDRTAPVITETWEAVVETASGVLVGPDSQLDLSVDEAEITEIIVDGSVQKTSGLTETLGFQQPLKSLSVVAEDIYNNAVQKDFNLIPDYQAPDVVWELLPPAIKRNGDWYAGETAELSLKATDASAIRSVKLNGQVVSWQDTGLLVKADDVILVSDTLGNSHSEPLHWQKDSAEPFVTVTVEGLATEFKKRLTVKANELIEIGFVDDGVGVKVQQYKGKTRKWLPLPKKFRFTSKGNYRIKLYSEDLVGNTHESLIKIKVKR